MASSLPTTADFNITRNDIIRQALYIAQVIPHGQEPTSQQLVDATKTFNSYIKGLQIHGTLMWTVENVQKTLSASSVVTGTDGNNYTCILGHTSSSSDQPISGANYSTYWVQGGSSPSSWATSTAYTAIGDFETAGDTIGVTQIWYRESDNDWPIKLISRKEFNDIPDKNETGTPLEAFFDPVLCPKIYLWPQPDNNSMVIHYSREKLLLDMDTASGNIDAPARWIDVFKYGLAANLVDEYGMPLDVRGYVQSKATALLRAAVVNDSQDVSGYMACPAYSVRPNGGAYY